MASSDPVHLTGTIPATLPKYTTVATFPRGTFLENLAVRHDGSILASDMLAGQVWYIDPRAKDPQASVELVWQFGGSDAKKEKEVDNGDQSEGEEHSHGMYSSTPAAEAIVESPIEPDVFYITSGVHGKQGTWHIYSLDMRSFDNENGGKVVHVNRLAAITSATWLNGGTALPHPTRPLILMAESYQGALYAYDIHSGTVSLWLSHPLLGKITTRPPWPALNGVKYHADGYVYFTNSDRAVLGRIKVDMTLGRPASENPNATSRTGEEAAFDVSILASGCAGDDLCLDAEGNIYIATNPMNTLLKISGLATLTSSAGSASSKPGSSSKEPPSREPERLVLLGVQLPPSSSSEATTVTIKEPAAPNFNPETVGPTAVAFGRTALDKRDLYVVTCGGIIHPLDGEVREARILRVELAA